MIRLLLCLACGLLAAGCGSPMQTTRIHRPDLTSNAYNDYVRRRTEQLQLMGGPYKDYDIALAKAQREATFRYGAVPPASSTTWSWGKEARKAAADAEFREKYSRNP